MTDSSDTAMYAVMHGDHAGSYIIQCGNTPTHINCLKIPAQSIISVPVDDFNSGVANKVLSHVENLPADIHQYCKHIYNEKSNEENNNI